MQTWLGLFTIFVGLGFNVSVLKLCSENRPAGESVFLYRKAILYTILSVIVGYLILIIASLLNIFSPDALINKYMVIFSISLLPLTISSVYMSYLQAKQMIRLYSNIQILTKLFSIATIIILTWFFKLEGFIISIVIGYFLTNIFLQQIIRKRINAAIEPIELKEPFKLHWNHASYSLGAAITDAIGMGLDILLLNYLIPDLTRIGYYSFAITIIGVYRILPGTIWTIAAPHFSGKMDDSTKWYTSYKKYNRLLLYLSGIITLISVFAIPFILKYFLNGKYEESGIFFILLVIAWGIRNLFTLKASVLFGMGKINLNFYSSFIYLIASAISIPIFVYYWEVIGAGIGVIVATVIGLISVQFFFHREKASRLLVFNEPNK
jgi:O-antigen/teichoic acid export membrane protein